MARMISSPGKPLLGQKLARYAEYRSPRSASIPQTGYLSQRVRSGLADPIVSSANRPRSERRASVVSETGALAQFLPADCVIRTMRGWAVVKASQVAADRIRKH
jgi:hypothetical protein